MKIDLNEFLFKNRETAQLVYGVSLIILIPILIAYNTVFIIKKYNTTLDVTLQREALTVGRTIYALVREDIDDQAELQKKINDLIGRNSQLQELKILKPEGDDFKVVASSRPEDVNKTIQFYYYNFAWTQPDNDGLATDSLLFSRTNEADLSEAPIDPDERYWLVALPMSDASGAKKAVLSIKISSKIVDDLTNYNRNISVYLLVGTVVIVILFLLIAVRLWDYVLLYRKMKEVDQMKDDFISMASHELRTPVTGIKGYVSMILDGTYGQVSDQVKTSLSIVENATDRLAVLVDDLLNVSRIEQGRIKITMEALNIAPIVKEIITELSVQAVAKKLELVYNPFQENFPPINIDPERLKQILINLIGNAIKYTPKGRVEVIIAEKSRGKTLEIKIKDTGIGMSAKDREKLFQKFYRVQNAATKEITGTGLGLWITKQLVELMGGTIMVDSMENSGTQFTIEFPVAKKQ